MRDYKNVKVPRKYRTAANRVTVKRASFERGPRKRQARPGPALAAVLITAVIVVGCYLGWKAYQWTEWTGVFQISGVDVKGVRHLTERDIKDVVGVFTGRNIFNVDIDAAARRARAHPWVKDVVIYRRLPNRISMVLTEREPAALLDAGGEKYLVDDEGSVIERSAKASSAGWPLPVIAIKSRKVRPGEQIATEGMAEALALLRELSKRGGRRRADVKVKADSAESLSIVYAGYEFKIGRGNYAEKFRRMGEIMADVKRRGLKIAYVDVRPERQAAVMVKNNEGRGPGSSGKGNN